MSNALSQPTQSTPHLAQELVDNIIDKLSSSKTTLKQCSTVSRSFHVSSRRHLFYFIHLDSIQTVFRFHSLLISTPSIARNVCKLQIELSKYDNLMVGDSEGKLVNLGGWLTNNTLLAKVLEVLPCAQTLVWRTYFSWNQVSSELRSALVKLFRSPSLTTIDIADVLDFPISALHIVSPVRRLELHSTRLHISDQRQVHLSNLEVLKIDKSDWQPEEVQLLVPNLRKISLSQKNDKQPGFLAQEAINASGRTLQEVWWYYKLGQSNHINLQGLFCLQFLTLLINPFYKGTSSEDWGCNFHITSLLKDTSIRQTLKDLTIGIVCPRRNLRDSDWQYLHDSKVWKDLNLVLSSILPLERVLIHLHFPGSKTVSSRVWAAFRESMSYPEERGILMFKPRSTRFRNKF